MTIVTFSSYQCLSCAFLAASLSQIRLAHPQDVRIIQLHAPQTGHDKDLLAIQAVETADLQGKFWEMNDFLYQELNTWSPLPPEEFTPWLITHIAGLGLDPIRFQADFESQEVAERLQQVAQSSSVDAPFIPPPMYVDTLTPYNGLVDFANLDAVVRLHLLAARQFSACPPMNIDPLKQYLATLKTGRGDVVVQLFPDKAPLAVNNFVFLARQGWYDGNTFYRVLPGEVAISGDPSATGLGNPGYLFETEIAHGLDFSQAGMLAMDNDGPGTNGSRFLLTLAPRTSWEGRYTIFGQVISGLEILAELTARDPVPGVSMAPGDELISITIEEH